MTLETWELLSYIVTVFGLPFAIAVFVLDRRKERDNEDEEAYQLLSDAYTDFLKVVLANPDLKLRSRSSGSTLDEEQHERVLVIFDMLVSLFERAYLLAWEPNMNSRQRRRWQSWEDYMREWVRREEFRRHLPGLLAGEDAAFAAYILRLAEEEAGR